MTKKIVHHIGAIGTIEKLKNNMTQNIASVFLDM